MSRGFIYYVSLTGVTGTRENLAGDLKENILRIKKIASQPVAVGFGISTPKHAAFAAEIADAAIVGSAIVKIIEKGSKPDQTSNQIKQFVRSLKDAI
jgi:tryptophan synthase alpha chain